MSTRRRFPSDGIRITSFSATQPVDQSNRAVVPKLQSFRQLTDGDMVASGKSLDGEKRLMLSRSDSSGMGRRFAKMDELPQRA